MRASTLAVVCMQLVPCLWVKDIVKDHCLTCFWLRFSCVCGSSHRHTVRQLATQSISKVAHSLFWGPTTLATQGAAPWGYWPLHAGNSKLMLLSPLLLSIESQLPLQTTVWRRSRDRQCPCLGAIILANQSWLSVLIGNVSPTCPSYLHWRSKKSLSWLLCRAVVCQSALHIIPPPLGQGLARVGTLEKFLHLADTFWNGFRVKRQYQNLSSFLYVTSIAVLSKSLTHLIHFQSCSARTTFPSIEGLPKPLGHRAWHICVELPYPVRWHSTFWWALQLAWLARYPLLYQCLLSLSCPSSLLPAVDDWSPSFPHLCPSSPLSLLLY